MHQTQLLEGELSSHGGLVPEGVFLVLVRVAIRFVQP